LPRRGEGEALDGVVDGVAVDSVLLKWPMLESTMVAVENFLHAED
jgi:hypothetical protein